MCAKTSQGVARTQEVDLTRGEFGAREGCPARGVGRRLDGSAGVDPWEVDLGAARAGAATFLRLSATTDGRERVLPARECRLGGPAPSSSEFAFRRTADHSATLSVCRSDSPGSGSTRRIAGTRLYRSGQLAADLVRFERRRRCHRHHHHLHRLFLAADAGEYFPRFPF